MPHDLFRSANHISLPLIQAHRQLPFRQGPAENRLCTPRFTVAGPSEAELSEKATCDRQPGGRQEMTRRPAVHFIAHPRLSVRVILQQPSTRTNSP